MTLLRRDVLVGLGAGLAAASLGRIALANNTHDQDEIVAKAPSS